jgi:hypothetical protein
VLFGLRVDSCPFVVKSSASIRLRLLTASARRVRRVGRRPGTWSRSYVRWQCPLTWALGGSQQPLLSPLQVGHVSSLHVTRRVPKFAPCRPFDATVDAAGERGEPTR